MKQPIECNVSLWDKKVGVLAHLNNKIYFQYDKSFLDSLLEISPIHLSLSSKVYETTNLVQFQG